MVTEVSVPSALHSVTDMTEIFLLLLNVCINSKREKEKKRDSDSLNYLTYALQESHCT